MFTFGSVYLLTSAIYNFKNYCFLQKSESQNVGEILVSVSRYVLGIHPDSRMPKISYKLDCQCLWQ